MVCEKQNSKVTIGDRLYTVGKESCLDGAMIYSFTNEHGDSQMRVYNISPGIKLTHHSVHTDRSYLGSSKKGNVIEIHHCREGRMERPYIGGHLYLVPGDLAIEIVKKNTEEFAFPLRHYHGITISINTDIAPKCFSCFLRDVKVQPLKVAYRLCEDRSCFVIRSKDYIDHLFSEMYAVPCENRKAYYKVKILELLLVLSGIDPHENQFSAYAVSNSWAELAKKAASFIADNRGRHITISSLSQKFHVSETHLQNIFRGVFGVPVATYVRVYKINDAALQLVKTDKTVMEIAQEIGYDNASKFASAFHRIMNETPLEYRRSHGMMSTGYSNAPK